MLKLTLSDSIKHNREEILRLHFALPPGSFIFDRFQFILKGTASKGEISMCRIKFVFLSIFIISIVAAPAALQAWWTEDGVVISVASGAQNRPRIAKVSEERVIIAWYDDRNGDFDIYVQSMDITGTAQWYGNGVHFCGASGDQYDPDIAADGNGGAIMAWEDLRNGNYDIYAGLIDSSGNYQWAQHGEAICTATGYQEKPKLISDGTGGAIIVWEDNRGGSDYNIYAQRIDATGGILWTMQGVAVCAASGDQHEPEIMPDGNGGAIIVWEDYRGLDYDLYAQRIDGSGTNLWTANGVEVSVAPGHQFLPRLISDESGGAIIAWYDYRGTNWDIYAQRLDSSGTDQWTSGGVSICSAADDQFAPELVPDGKGGAIITWEDNRSGSDSDVYAQRVNDSGTVQWTTDGVVICEAASDQDEPKIASDGQGGAIITWYDFRTGKYDIHAQRIDTSGITLWEPDGAVVCMAAEDQKRVQIVSDGTGGAYLVWFDMRDAGDDIYGQQIGSNGEFGSFPPGIHSVMDVPGDEGGYINLAWDANRFDFERGEVSQYTVWRALDTEQAQGFSEEGAVIVSNPSEAISDGLFRAGGEKIIRYGIYSGEPYYWMLVGTQDAFRLEHYSMIVKTMFDSTSVCQDYHYLQVIAHTDDPSMLWTSLPDSGYSVDNISPCPPAGLAGEQSYQPAGLQLSWSPNTEEDLGCYNVYRGNSEGFVPGPGNFVNSACDTALFDGGWSWDEGYYYKVAAVDIHGNESTYALLAPEDVTDTETPEMPESNFLSQNFPNPFNPSTTIRFGLESPAHVRIDVYDTAGRKVCTLLNGTRDAGIYSVSWNGTVAGGGPVSSGVYFYSIRAEEYSERKKMVLIR